jgi:hypothetical protein
MPIRDNQNTGFIIDLYVENLSDEEYNFGPPDVRFVRIVAERQATAEQTRESFVGLSTLRPGESVAGGFGMVHRRSFQYVWVNESSPPDRPEIYNGYSFTGLLPGNRCVPGEAGYLRVSRQTPSVEELNSIPDNIELMNSSSTGMYPRHSSSYGPARIFTYSNWKRLFLSRERHLSAEMAVHGLATVPSAGHTLFSNCVPERFAAARYLFGERRTAPYRLQTGMVCGDCHRRDRPLVGVTPSTYVPPAS